MDPSKITLETFLEIDPDARNYFKRYSPQTYEDFTAVLYDDLVEVCKVIEESRSLRENDSEDRISMDLCIYLRQLSNNCYFATHNTHQSGNVDITVEHKKNGHKWIGEAKKFRSLDTVLEGFKQLTTRYSLAAPAYKAGLLAYIEAQRAAEKMSDWRNHLVSQKLESFSLQDCRRRPGLHFYSTHVHESTGLPFEVWHVGIALHYDPKDKSALATKARRAKKETKQ